MTRNIELELNELKNTFPQSVINHWSEGGVDFFELKNFPIRNVTECVLQVGKFLGYDSRLFLPRVIKTETERNWNHKDILIRNKKYSAFSFRVPNSSLVDILLGHLGGLN